MGKRGAVLSKTVGKYILHVYSLLEPNNLYEYIKGIDTYCSKDISILLKLVFPKTVLLELFVYILIFSTH